MKRRYFTLLLSSMALFLSLTAGTCSKDDDECVAAKMHMCTKIPEMNCWAFLMDNAQTKIKDACGQAELDAYIPVVQNACSEAIADGADMNCKSITSKRYASSDAGESDTDGGVACDAGTPFKFTYTGASTATGQSAQLEFSIASTIVTGGRLQVSAQCGTNIQLPSTDIQFTGSLLGTWESATGTINATWAGGETACDGSKLTAAMGYPTSGSLTIQMVGGKVQLQRAISNAMPYEFTASNQTYTPPPVTCSTR
jgi:hypothetical protein